MALHEPLAIVGIGCRFPGAPDVESFWRVLRAGIETVGNYSEKRFEYIDQVYSAESVDRGLIASRRGGFVPQIDRFDAEFFGISPREAALLDPQQRMLMEVAWEAIEDAGMPPERLAGTRTGVYIGLWSNDYERCIHDHSRDADFYATTGGGRYPASGRLAYFFDLRGPNLTVDTACSSSLVAIHLACQSIWNDESEMALAGGANAILSPEITIAYSASQMLSPQGRCKFGDASADGYVRSEGAGIVFLKRLSQAMANADPIYAVVRGSAINNDGRSSGFLILPSREGQKQMLRAALRDAGVKPEAVDYIEAHGTGTQAGDPVELEAIGAVLGETPRRRPCGVGSVKTNLGHTEGAAGVAGVIKVALSLDRGIIPASLHFTAPNPNVSWARDCVMVQTKAAAWPQGATPRVAGISGFGITGTNAHVVLEGAPVPVRHRHTPAGAHIFLLSAQTPAALEARAASWRGRLMDDAGWPESLADLAYTASVRRAHHDFRLAIVAGTRQELLDQIRDWLAKQERPGVRSGKRVADAKHRAVFVFPGQGGQWMGMGRTLFRDAPVFRAAIEACDEAIHKCVGWRVSERMLAAGSENGLDQIDVVQPVLFAVMMGLAALWRSFGVEPEAVVGHSMGEVAAAVVCGALSLDEAAGVICGRSRLMKRASGQGLMAVTELSLEDATRVAADYGGRISVAANNSPTSTVLSGDASAIEDLLIKLEACEIFCRRIKVDVASHSAHMDPFRKELAELLRGIDPRAGSVPLYSTVTGQVESGIALDADYWSRNLRNPVLFSTAMQSLLGDGFDTFIEMSPHPVLLQAIEDGIGHASTDGVAIASLRRDKDERAELLDALGSLHVRGFPLDFSRVYSNGACLRLPSYPWQRERHWLEAENDTSLRPLSNARYLKPDNDNRIYLRDWVKVESSPAAVSGKKSWLLIGEPGALIDQMARQLELRGDHCARVSDVERARTALESVSATYDGIVRLPRSRGADAQEATGETLDIVRLAQIMASAQLKKSPRLWLISTSAWPLPNDSAEIAVAQGAAWGIGRVIAAEYPDWFCANVDISPEPTPDELDNLSAWLHGDGCEEQIAIRHQHSFVARLARDTRTGSKSSPEFFAAGTYLITGGLGGAGMNLATWLVRSGAGHVALVGRHAPSPEAQKIIRDMESTGAKVHTFSADVADEHQVSRLLEDMAAEMPPLLGIFHLAAVMDSTLLTNITEAEIERAMHSKAAGAWALHRQTENMPLDFFVLFSSMTATIGQPGVASYAAANAYLDALARYRRAKGLQALSIEWGPWSELGLTRNDKTARGVKLYAEQGIRPLSFEETFSALRELMGQDISQAVVAPIDWVQFAQSFVGNSIPRFFLPMLPASGTQSPHTQTSNQAPELPIREKLLGATPGRLRRGMLETYLQQVLASILKTSESRVDSAKPFGSMGVDSLMALQFVRRLAPATGVQLPATAVFNFPTLKMLAVEIARRMGISLDGEIQSLPLAAIADAVAVPAGDIASLSEEETIQALLHGGGTE